jgi:indolepyruvate ferredoxin oxidoreductase alpha subunit
VEARLERLKEYAETTPLNRIELNNTKIGVITNGVTYQYVKETLKDVSILKLGMTFPLPRKLITEFADKVDTLYVIEELDPFIEDYVKSWGIPVHGKDTFSTIGELLPETIAETMGILPKVPAALEDRFPIPRASTGIMSRLSSSRIVLRS